MTASPIYIFDTPLNNINNNKKGQTSINQNLSTTPVKIRDGKPLSKRKHISREGSSGEEKEDIENLKQSKKKIKKKFIGSPVSKSKNSMDHDKTKLSSVIIRTSLSEEFKDKIKDSVNLEAYINQFIHNYEKTLITKAGDVHIYSSDPDEIDLMLNDPAFFSNCSKIETNFDKRPQLFLYGLTRHEIEENGTITNELKENGIVDFVEVRSKMEKRSTDEIRPVKLMKLLCKNEEVQLKLICSGIRLNNKQYTVEPAVFIEQCSKCHKLEHTIEKCQSSTMTCSNCNLAHDLNIRCRRPPRCANCLGNHSSKFKNCTLYQTLKSDKIQKFKMQLMSKTKTPIETIYNWEKLSRRSFGNFNNQSEVYEIGKRIESIQSENSSLQELMKKSLQNTENLIKSNNELVVSNKQALESMAATNESIKSLELNSKILDNKIERQRDYNFLLFDSLISLIVPDSGNALTVQRNFKLVAQQISNTFDFTAPPSHATLNALISIFSNVNI